MRAACDNPTIDGTARPRAGPTANAPHGFPMKLPMFLVLGLFSLAACAQSSPPAAAAQPDVYKIAGETIAIGQTP